MKAANLALRFLLELAALAAFAYWGATGPWSSSVRVGLAVGTPAVAALVWGLFVAPRSRVALPTLARLGIGLAVFLSAAAALAARGHGRLAGGFALMAVLNTVLLLVWQQDRVVSRSPP